MTAATHTTRLENALNAACAALQSLPDDHADEDVAAACDRIDAVVTRIEKTLPMATLGDLRLHAKALRTWHDGTYGRAPGSLERLLTVLEHLPPRLWDEKLGP